MKKSGHAKRIARRERCLKEGKPVPNWCKNTQCTNRDKLNNIKVSKGCKECGFNKHPCALEFDHRGDAVKIANVSALLRHGWEIIEAEIAKCDILCSNCHRIKTHERRKNNGLPVNWQAV